MQFLEETQKPDWKQWIPLYGSYQIWKDIDSEKSTIIDKMPSTRFYGSSVE